jgi:hypothetical protein
MPNRNSRGTGKILTPSPDNVGLRASDAHKRLMGQKTGNRPPLPPSPLRVPEAPQPKPAAQAYARHMLDNPKTTTNRDNEFLDLLIKREANKRRP